MPGNRRRVLLEPLCSSDVAAPGVSIPVPGGPGAPGTGA